MKICHIGVICAAGIGDALILHMVSHHLQALQYKVTTFSNHLPLFGPWLQGYTFAPQPQLDAIESTFQPFDALFLQHDNSPKSKKIRSLALPVYTFYGAHLLSKHGPLQMERDFVCNPHQTMVENIGAAMRQFFGSSSKENGLIPPQGLVHKKFKKRIAIHPTSTNIEKNWPREKFLQLADYLRKTGYEPIFTVAPHECKAWNSPLFKNLSDLASFIYESSAFLGTDSGIGHLASYLQIPHLTIGADPIQLRLWRPGWGRGALVTPPPWLAGWKAVKKRWELFVSKRKVIKELKKNGILN